MLFRSCQNTMGEQGDLLLDFHYLFDGDRNCYLVGARIRGSPGVAKERLDNKKVCLYFHSTEPGSERDYIPFVPVGKCYHTERLYPVPVTEAQNPFANVRADLHVANRYVNTHDLTNLINN